MSAKEAELLSGANLKGNETMKVAALFVDPKGPYFDREDVDPWDESRDARKYDGDLPVVAHPPCHRWVNMAGLNFIRYTRERGCPQPHLRPGNDGGCFARALESVRKWGGVLEHPAGSHAWPTFALLTPPRGGGWVEAREGEWTCEVWQSAYGHKARKRTWLYYIGNQAPPELRWSQKAGTHQVGWFDRRRPTLGKREASATPEEFAEVLISMAFHARGRL
jgi:hypothetical protein